MPLHITDVAPVQLKLARSKAEQKAELVVTRMNAEQLGYKTDSFSTIVLFFLAAGAGSLAWQVC